MKLFANTARTLACIGLVATLSAPTALAQPEAIGKYKNWVVFVDDSSGEKLCYAATEAKDKAPVAAEHGDVWFYVTNWKSGRARNQPSLKVGYELRSDRAPRASIGRSGWSMFSAKNEAFAEDSDDAAMVRALRAGSELRVTAVSARNTNVSYHFSLSGSSAAIKKAAALCR
ncbi:MAG: invasion associated locus B family protein [Hyphomonas sp.]